SSPFVRSGAPPEPWNGRRAWGTGGVRSVASGVASIPSDFVGISVGGLRLDRQRRSVRSSSPWHDLCHPLRSSNRGEPRPVVPGYLDVLFPDHGSKAGRVPSALCAHHAVVGGR